jgi:hypothetical protein
MLEKKSSSAAVLALALLLSGPATAAIAWDESLDGDLSNDPLAPTVLSFVPGPNDVIGSAGAPPGTALAPFKQDFFTFTVPTGYELSALNAVALNHLTADDVFSFIGIESGPQITHDVSAPNFGGNADGLLGWLHVPFSAQGTNILPAMGVPSMGSTGFTGALGPGQYAVWVQDDDPFSFDYSFQISVPEPSTWMMMLVGLAGLGFVGHRRRAPFGV